MSTNFFFFFFWCVGERAFFLKRVRCVSVSTESNLNSNGPFSSKYTKIIGLQITKLLHLSCVTILAARSSFLPREQKDTASLRRINHHNSQTKHPAINSTSSMFRPQTLFTFNVYFSEEQQKKAGNGCEEVVTSDEQQQQKFFPALRQLCHQVQVVPLLSSRHREL